LKPKDEYRKWQLSRSSLPGKAVVGSMQRDSRLFVSSKVGFLKH